MLYFVLRECAYLVHRSKRAGPPRRPCYLQPPRILAAMLDDAMNRPYIDYFGKTICNRRFNASGLDGRVFRRAGYTCLSPEASPEPIFDFTEGRSLFVQRVWVGASCTLFLRFNVAQSSQQDSRTSRFPGYTKPAPPAHVASVTPWMVSQAII